LSFSTQRHHLVAKPFDLVSHANKTVSSPRNIGFHLRHHLSVSPPKSTPCIRAFLVMKREVAVESIEVNLLFWNPTKRDDSRRQTVNRRSRMRCQAQRAFNIGVGHVHEHGLGHVVEVVPQSDDVCTESLRKVIDALTTENTAVRASHSWSIIVFLNRHGEALNHLVHFDKGEFWIGYDMVLNAKSFA